VIVVAPSVPEPARSERLLVLHLNAAVQRFGAAALGVIDLPPLSEGALEPAQIRLAAVLYWCMALEQAGVLAVVEALAAEFRRGGLALDQGSAAARLERFARDRHDRFTPEERQALYHRIFDDRFDDAFGRLAAALDEAGRAPQGATLHAQVGISTIGGEVAQLVSARSVGTAGFAAREIVADIRAAWALLQDRQLQAAVGARTAWDVVERLGPSLVGPIATPDRSNTRADAGRMILGWLADQTQAVQAGTATPPPEIVQAGSRWWLAAR
jgi:hypothetical protein